MYSDALLWLDRELAWAAGFFDGEGTMGCYGVKDKRAKSLSLRVGQTTREPLERFLIAVQGGRISGPQQVKSKWNNKPRFEYYISGEQAHSTAQMLLPYLCEPKRLQIANAVRMWLNRIKLGEAIRSRTHCARGHGFDDAYIKPNGTRNCRICRHEASMKHYAKYRDEQKAKYRNNAEYRDKQNARSLESYYRNRDAILKRRAERRRAKRQGELLCL